MQSGVDSPTVATAIAQFIVAQGVKRVYSLPGSHVKPIWSELVRAGIRVVSARHECAAVHMAHAEAQLTGLVGVALVTAGPGLTNAVTGLASAHLTRTPLLLMSARVPDPQSGMGALEEVPQADLVRPVCRSVREVSDDRHVLPALHMAVASALGFDGSPGPAYVDFDPILLKLRMSPWHRAAFRITAVARSARLPDPTSIEHAAGLLRRSRRPLVIAGHAALGARDALQKFLETTGCLYLDTRESRGALPSGSPFAVPAVRSRAIAESDLIVTLGKRLDYEVAYGSAAVFSDSARFIRIGRSADELCENRPGDVEVCADVDRALEALLRCNPIPTAPDLAWKEQLLGTNAEKVREFGAAMTSHPAGSDGHMHPLTLIDAINRIADRDTICVVDGGDILSFARVGLRPHTLLDNGPFGCLGAGVPYAVASALACPSRKTIALLGDGAFGFTAMEVETAVRNGAAALFVIANNSAWNIERQDELAHYPGQDLGTKLTPCRYDLLARSLGAYGERVEHASDLDLALQRGLARAPAVIDVTVTRDAVSPDSRSGLARIPPLHAVERWDELERRKLDRSD